MRPSPTRLYRFAMTISRMASINTSLGVPSQLLASTTPMPSSGAA
jgi:hypothetical protein